MIILPLILFRVSTKMLAFYTMVQDVPVFCSVNFDTLKSYPSIVPKKKTARLRLCLFNYFPG